jgi:tripartite-type tricarboxylate transporter receptor subunit TctC
MNASNSIILRRRTVLGALAALPATSLFGQQIYPSKPVRFVIGFAAGGGVDAQARMLADGLQRQLGQPFTVDNRPGAGGKLATEIVVHAEPDGYTLGAITGADALLAVTDPRLPYKFPADLAPITMVADYPFAIVTAIDGPYKTFADLLKAAKQPNVVSSASAGLGTTHHLAAELLNAMGGLDILHVPYKGSSSSTSDVIGGRVSVQFAASPGLLASGKLRALAVTSPKRSPAWGDVPAVAEFLPGYEVTSWTGLVAPAKTPPAVIAKVAAETHEVLKTKSAQERMKAIGLEIVTSTPAQLLARAESDMVKWRNLVRSRNIKVNE